MPETNDRRRGRPKELTAKEARRVLAALRLVVKDNGGNQSAAARALGLTQSAVSQLLAPGEKANRPGMETARRLAAARGVEVWALLSGAA